MLRRFAGLQLDVVPRNLVQISTQGRIFVDGVPQDRIVIDRSFRYSFGLLNFIGLHTHGP